MKNASNNESASTEVVPVTPVLLMLVPNGIGPANDLVSLMSQTEGVYSNWVDNEAGQNNMVEAIAILQTTNASDIVVTKEILETYPPESTEAQTATQYYHINYSLDAAVQNYLWYFKFPGPDSTTLLVNPNINTDTVPLVSIEVNHDPAVLTDKSKRKVKSVPVKAFKGDGK